MGSYVNPGNEGFAKILKSRYVDKTGLISTFDDMLDSQSGLVMVSRPRRFGKSFAAKSLVAFYSCGCDSRTLFEGLDVSRREGWDANLNALNVVSVEMTGLIRPSSMADIASTLSEALLPELREIMPKAGSRYRGAGDLLRSAILDVVRETGRRFVFIIDEWDAPYRLTESERGVQDSYAEWLRGMFKNSNFTPEAVAGAYLTGILPIKKYAHQSAVSDFDEFTMISPGKYAPFVGFTGEEVSGLCEEYDMDLADVRRWYDGYRLSFRELLLKGSRTRFCDRDLDVYAPYSLMRACESAAGPAHTGPRPSRSSRLAPI